MHRGPQVPLMSKHTGVCVECVSDCECGVDEYCGYDYKDGNDFGFKVKVPPGITSSNKGSHSGVMDNVRKEIELYAMQFEGLPIRHTRTCSYTQCEPIAKCEREKARASERAKPSVSCS